MRRFLFSWVFIGIMFSIPTTTAWSFGMYDWYGGFDIATAVGFNGKGSSSITWNNGHTSKNIDWNSKAYAFAYANAYPPSKYQIKWGWAGASASALAANGTRSAMARAEAYKGILPYLPSGAYARVTARTVGSPTFAYATACPYSSWQFEYQMSRMDWNAWTALYGPKIPLNLKWYYWGWLDGDPDAKDMAVSMNLWAIDPITGNNVGILEDGFKDTGWENGIVNGTYTYSQLGNTLNPKDLVFNPNVGGIGHPGWDIIGHNGTIATDTPYEIPFMISAKEVGGDANNVELLVEFQMDGNIGQTPEPCTMVLMGSGLLMLAGGTRRKMKGACQSKGMVINDR